MTEIELLQNFNRQQISLEMVKFLIENTNLIFEFNNISNFQTLNTLIDYQLPTMRDFIITIINNSKVSTGQLMTTIVYLKKLQDIVLTDKQVTPKTPYCLFLVCLIIAAKTLNDSSPLNKHWSRHTNGLLTVEEINETERLILGYLKWDVCFTTSELVNHLKPLIKTNTNHRNKYSPYSKYLSYPNPYATSSTQSTPKKQSSNYYTVKYNANIITPRNTEKSSPIHANSILRDSIYSKSPSPMYSVQSSSNYNISSTSSLDSHTNSSKRYSKCSNSSSPLSIYSQGSNTNYSKHLLVFKEVYQPAFQFTRNSIECKLEENEKPQNVNDSTIPDLTIDLENGSSIEVNKRNSNIFEKLKETSWSQLFHLTA